MSPQQKVCGCDIIWSLKLTFTHVYADRSTGVGSSYLHFVSILQSQKVRNINTTEQDKNDALSDQTSVPGSDTWTDALKCRVVINVDTCHRIEIKFFQRL